MNAIKLSIVAVSLFATVATAEDPHDDLHDQPRHRPHGSSHDGHAHAHPGIDLTHPIVTESPLPETHLRLDYNFAYSGDGREHSASAAVEYAFTSSFSVEAVLPYTFLDPDDGDSTDGLSDAIVAMKFATYRFVDHGFLPAVGVELVLPTGDEERGIGSDHVLEVEPFFRIGYWTGKWEFIGTLSLGLPFNQTDEEDDEEDFALAYNLSTLYHVTPDLQALVELSAESVFGSADEFVLSVSPGVTFQPFDDKSITIGVGATIPLTDDKPFDYGVNVMTIIHF
jgi:hypothetical protein